MNKLFKFCPLIRIAQIIALLLVSSSRIAAQAASINTMGTPPHASAILDLTSSSKGLLIPRMDSAQRTMISNPANGLLVYQTNGANPGFYYYSGATWNKLATTSVGSNSSDGAKAKIVYQVPAGSGGGGAVANTWVTRPINTILYDNIGLSLSSNQITLPPGAYEVSAYCVFGNANYNVGWAKIRLQNMTSPATLGICLNSSMSVAANFSNYPVMLQSERFTLNTTSAIALQYFIDAPDFGPGIGTSGQPERFAEIILTRLQ